MKPCWESLVHESIESPESLAEHIAVDIEEMNKITDVYPMRINPYFLDMVKKVGEPLARQVIPDTMEVDDAIGMIDPLAEDRDSPVPFITHRYPDRVLFLVSSQCGVYCRFCTRKRKIGKWEPIQDKALEEGFRYIHSQKKVRDVLLSGGDPLLLSDSRLKWILENVREIRHVDVIRIGTRVPAVLPQRITTHLIRLLVKFQPLYIITHFNHPAEITMEARKACTMLADAGLNLNNQTVLLKGINDQTPVMARLMCMLLQIRVKPYYLHQCDLTKGTNHFRTSIQKGIDIIRNLRGNISGLALPTYVVDLPGGGGKVPIMPNYVVESNSEEVIMKNYQGKIFRYPLPGIGQNE